MHDLVAEMKMKFIKLMQNQEVERFLKIKLVIKQFI
jgi:hypothetical protein